MPTRRGVSNILAMLLLISLSIAGAGVYYLAATGFLRPQPNLSSQVTMSVGASGFAVISVQIANTGGIAFRSVSILMAGPSSSELQISYSAVVVANGGEAAVTVQGISGGPYSTMSSSASVSGNLVAATGSSYSVTVQAYLTNGGTYQQAYSLTALP